MISKGIAVLASAQLSAVTSLRGCIEVTPQDRGLWLEYAQVVGSSTDAGIVVADAGTPDPFSVIASSSNIVVASGHGFATGDGPVRLIDGTEEVPPAIDTDTDYWLVVDSDVNLQLAPSRADALAGTNIVTWGQTRSIQLDPRGVRQAANLDYSDTMPIQGSPETVFGNGTPDAVMRYGYTAKDVSLAASNNAFKFSASMFEKTGPLYVPVGRSMVVAAAAADQLSTLNVVWAQA